MFCRHIDVVPTGKNWEVDPFFADVIDGVITAKGAQDMKSGDACVFICLQNMPNFDGTCLFINSDEEGQREHGTIKC